METAIPSRVSVPEKNSSPSKNGSAASALFEELLPPGVATAELIGEGDTALLLAGERQLLRRATPERAREFAAGRLCARGAAAQFGIADVPIGVRDDRLPVWPRLLTGSITHTHGFCAAAVGERRRFLAIGIDAEGIGRLSSDLWSQVLLPAETDWLESRPATEQVKVATLMFSAKEAFYKCQYEVTGQWLEFKDVTVDLTGREKAGDSCDWRSGSFTVRPVARVKLFEHDNRPVTGRFACTNERVLTALAIAAD